MAKFDSMYFENNRCHVLAGIRNAEEHFESCDAEGVKIALDCAFGHLGNMRNEIERHSETIEAQKALAQYDEMKSRYSAIKAKYDSKYGELEELDPEEVEIEDDEDETIENEEVEEEKNVDILKLNEVVATTIETIREFNKDFSVDDVDEMNRAIVLIQGLKEAVNSDLSSILEKLEDARKDSEIIAKVEEIHESFDGTNQTIEETIDELRHFSELKKGDGRTAILSAAAVFAAIHQTTGEIAIDYECFYQNYFEVPYSGLDSYNFRYSVEDNVCGTIGVYLDLFLFSKRTGDQYKLATIKTLEEGDDVFRKMSALGCEYALAFKNIAKNI